jgi:hypothetical protein
VRATVKSGVFAIYDDLKNVKKGFSHFAKASSSFTIAGFRLRLKS